MASNLFTPQYIQYVYIPSAVLVAGATLLKPEWVPYALALSALLAGFTAFNNQSHKVLKPNDFQNFTLKEKTVLSHNTAIYRFGLPRSNDILGLPIGQHISVAAKVGDKEVVRSYTPISSDSEPGFFDLLIKSYPTGNISKYIGEMKIGQSIKVKGPKGAMVYTPNMVKHFGMIAGGTGITPMLQIIKAVIAGRSKGDKTEIDLIFANVNDEDILLRKDLNELAQQDDKVRIYHVLNNPPEKWDGGVGFVTADIIKAHLPAPANDIKILICGPPPMVSAMKSATTSLGYDKPRPVSKLEDQVFCF